MFWERTMLDRLLPVILVALVVGMFAYRGLIRQETNLLAFSLAFGSLLGWTVGSFLGNPQPGSAIGAIVGPLCVLPLKTFRLTGRPAQMIGIGWILTGAGWIAWILRGTLQ